MQISPKIKAALTLAGNQDDTDIDIGETALTLAAAGRPGAWFAPYRRHLEKITDEVGAYAQRGPRDVPLALRHEALVQVIHKRMGYAGTEDSFDDIDAANLMQVIDRRSGLPVAIGILYLHAAAKLGWAACGVDFPGRFLLRLDTDAGRLIFDPFDGGRELTPPDLRLLLKAITGPGAELTQEHYRSAGPRGVLLRLQNNIKIRRLEANQPEAALAIVESMVMIAPLEPALWRECGLLHARLEHIAKAVAALEEFLRLSVSEQARYSTSSLLQELRGRLG